MSACPAPDECEPLQVGSAGEVEAVWAFLRGNKPSNRVFTTYNAIVDACRDAWTWLTKQPERITAIGTRTWAQVTP